MYGTIARRRVACGMIGRGEIAVVMVVVVVVVEVNGGSSGGGGGGGGGGSGETLIFRWEISEKVRSDVSAAYIVSVFIDGQEERARKRVWDRASRESTVVG